MSKSIRRRLCIVLALAISHCIVTQIHDPPKLLSLSPGFWSLYFVRSWSTVPHHDLASAGPGRTIHDAVARI
ncbi:hypothetical protein BGZ61DRAFT_443843 [Ilyonectria robusta]|uniref:uncharacterized protein n=1 Tax=Ilyonectria robusta TaxID=1079257 RepID=UPI001E8E9907|nr:uncharacterized protein BGZ61DRAFT_443843 [Ilyonectria robusta]KAH8735173.1 hypothetical protein BGZ61DRAFT_443843 [Ilyonectria robusta]